MTYCKNKQMKYAYKNYLHAENTSLEDCYKNYSQAKENAFYYCKQLQNKYNGVSFKIISYNCMQFSAGFVGEIIEDAIAKKIFVYITKNYDRFCYIEDLEN